MILLPACAAPLLDELVVPGDVPVATTIGEEGSALGTRVAVRDGEVLATAPGAAEVRWLGEGSVAVGAGTLVPWFEADGAYVGRVEEGIHRLPEGGLVVELPEARAFGGGEHGHAWATDHELVHADGRRWTLPGVRDLALDGERVLALACDGGCVAWALDDEGAVALGEAGEGGRIAVSEGAACWSDPELAEDLGRGVVYCEDGREIAGEPGDHLGRALTAGWAAGGLNPELVPHRARIVPLDGGAVLAVDRSVETRPLALANDGATLVIGVPGYPLDLAGAGAVHVLSLSELP